MSPPQNLITAAPGGVAHIPSFRCRCRRTVASYRTGANLAPDNPAGTIDFPEYLAETKQSLLI